MPKEFRGTAELRGAHFTHVSLAGARFHGVRNEEWWHHSYAVRDLAALAG